MQFEEVKNGDIDKKKRKPQNKMKRWGRSPEVIKGSSQRLNLI